MNKQLINQIKTRADVSEETAIQAAEAVVAFLEEKLPDAVAPHVKAVLNGETMTDSIQDAIGDKLGGLGGLFGGDD